MPTSIAGISIAGIQCHASRPTRNLVERFFNKLKNYRGIATRFDKLANTFMAGVLLVCMILWLN